MSANRYFYIYQNLAEQLTDYLQQIHKLHKKVYVTIYKCYDSEIMDVYTKELEPTFKEFSAMPIHQQADSILDITDVHSVPSIKEIYSRCSKQDKTNTPMGYDLFEAYYKNFVLTGLSMSINYALGIIQTIDADITDLYRTRIFRSDQELAIIYHYIKKTFDEHTLPILLSHFSNEKKRYFEDRKQEVNAERLVKLFDDTEKLCKNHTLYKIWFDNSVQGEEDAAIATLLCKEEATPTAFETLFKYQGIYGMLKDEIAKQRNYENNGDPFFTQDIDPCKLEEYLKFWIKAEINTQEKWYIVWCLMKYTFRIVREGQTKKNFEQRMNLMFPDAEKKCKEESFRKQENKLNHNKHFSEWIQTSSDYTIAKSLYEKLKHQELYKRTGGSVFG